MWYFKKAAHDDTIKTSKLAEFFSNRICEAVVRESIQNSLDAGNDSGEAVKVCFTFGTALKSSFPEIYQPLEGHLKATGYHEEIPQNIRYITIEDFNTKGLQGRLSKFDSPNDRSSFYSFWWEEGEGTKKKGSGGSHGVGKSTLSNASQLKSFLALTIREEEPNLALLGFCDLPPHEVDSELYLGYARFGHETDETGQKELLPQTETYNLKTIERFKQHANLKRENQSGLSIFIPQIGIDFTPEETIREIIKNYFLPIIKSGLIVEIDDQNNSNNSNNCKINAETIQSLTEEYFSEDKLKEELLTLIKISKSIAKFKSDPKYFNTISEPNRENTKLAIEMFSKENLLDMRKEFQDGKVVPIHVTIPINLKSNGEKRNGHISIYALNEGCKSKFYRAFRGDILINKEKCLSPCSYTALIIDIDNFAENELSEYLKYTEDPGHCEWKNSAAIRSKGRYSQNESWVRTAVQKAASSVLNVLSDVNENEKITNFAEDIFFIEKPSEEDASNDNKNSGRKKGKKKPAPPEGIPAPNKTLFDSKRIDQGGIQFFGTAALVEQISESPEEEIFGRVRAAHVMSASSKAKWFKEYNPADFSFDSTIKVNSSGIDPVEIKDNEMTFKVIDPAFSINMTGFDTNRDVHFEINKVKER